MQSHAPSGGVGWRRLGRWGFWPLVLGVVAYDLAMLRAEWPPPDMKTIVSQIEAGRLAEAEDALRAWTRYSPSAPEARLNLARVLAARNDLKGCALELRAVPAWAPSKAEALFREGQTWQALDRARDAESAFRAYLVDDPNHTVARPYRDTAEVELINLLMLEGRWDETRALIWTAYPRASDRTQREELLIMSLRALLERSAPGVSVGPLRRFVAADPEDFEARMALALAEHETKDEAAADAQIAACLRLRPTEPRLWRVRLRILKDRGDLDAMRRALAEAPPEVAPALAGFRGQVLAQDGKFEEALAAFETAVAREPGEADLHYRLSLVARRLGHTRREQDAQRRVQALRTAREALSDDLKAYETERRSGSAPVEHRDPIAARLASTCRTLGFERDAREWARLGSAEVPNQGGPAS